MNEALDLILDCNPGEDKNIEPGEGKAGRYSAYYWGHRIETLPLPDAG